ncbi:TIGR04222 domain-containing membrane protein [Kribbella sp. NBC_00382]|uniref:TIGR04222 domain-containing membrane protein n=1 Tax=Kribbella sp. NBC_00382 TaxID=2975967 RepID=UPI002E246E67
MTRAAALSLHELSYLCGGPRRAVLTAVLALCQSEQLEIGADGRAHRLDEVGWGDALEQAVLDVVPSAGLELESIVDAVAESKAMRATRGMLAARGLALRWFPGLTGAGRRARHEVLTNPPEGLRRIAVLGAEAIQDAQLRRTLTDPTYRQRLTLTPCQTVELTP